MAEPSNVREYIGSRYVPIIADPIEWNSTRAYEPLTIVSHQGNSYTSRQFVPIGIDIADSAFWALTGNYNAQVEQYRQEVQGFASDIADNTAAVNALKAIIPDSAYSSSSTVQDAIQANAAAIGTVSDDLADLERDISDDIAELTQNLAPVVERFDTFQALANAAIAAGNVYETRGYAVAGDGGAGAYLATASSNELTIATATTGVYLLYLPAGAINAAALGCIGATAQTNLDMAIRYGNVLRLPVKFPAEITTAGTINVGSTPVTLEGNLTYTGTGYAIEVKDPAFADSVELYFRKISAENGSGIRLWQSDSNHTITNPYIEGSRIEAGNFGIVIQADTWGILEGDIKIGRVRTGSTGVKLICNQLDPDKTSFIGQICFDIKHIQCSSDYAIRMDAPSDSTITGCYFDAMSFENSSNGLGIFATGEVKGIELESLRVLEAVSFTNIIYAHGAVRDMRVNCASPIRIDKVDIETTVAFSSSNIYIEGGILSPTGYRFADTAFYSTRGRTFRYDFETGQNQSSNFTFGSQSNQWRCFKEFRNNLANTTVEIRNLEYFSPWGIDRIYLNQNKGNGSIYVLYDVYDNVIFNGANMTETARTTYEIRALFDSTHSTIKYAINPMNGTSTSA